jgi:hypothetical protein
MAANKIRIAKDKADLVKSLTLLDNNSGPFQTYADVIVFAEKAIALGGNF